MQIPIPDKVKLELKAGEVDINGPLGKLTQRLPGGITLKIEGANAVVTTTDVDNVAGGPLHGLARTLVANAIAGVTKGFKKELEIVGLGYRASANRFPDPDGKRGTPAKRGFISNAAKEKVYFQIGFAHDIEFHLPAGVKVAIDGKQTFLTITGTDAYLVGEVAAQIRRLKPPEPYKGTGIKYAGEHIIRKAGKTAAGAVGGGAGGGKK